MRKSKYDEAFPSQPISEKDKHSSEIDKRIELSSEVIDLNQQIETIKILSKEFKVLETLAINAIDANEKSLKALKLRPFVRMLLNLLDISSFYYQFCVCASVNSIMHLVLHHLEE